MITSMPEILGPAFNQRYGVLAVNVVDPLSMGAVLQAAQEKKSPVIIQVSPKTVKYWENFVPNGAVFLQQAFAAMAGNVTIPATLHLDHCPDRGMITQCFKAGWNSVLFDGSKLSFADCLEQTRQVVDEARWCGAAVEGEVEAIKGVEDGVGSDYASPLVPLDQVIEFIKQTAIDSFAAGIGTAHGLYKGEPNINFDRVTQIVDLYSIPIVIHGGTGLAPEVIKELVRRGGSKFNWSTGLKIIMNQAYGQTSANLAPKPDPLKQSDGVVLAIKIEVAKLIDILGSAGRATA